MYKQGIQKFPDCTPLKINYAFFLMEKMNRKVEALQELSHASNFNPPVDEQFVIYRYKKISEDFGDGFGDAHGGAMDMVAKFAYDAAFKQL